jgi:anti-sigma factor RsiW
MRWRRTPRGISCHELVELVTDYLDGALSAVEAARFEAHLETCRDCAAYVAQFARTINALGSLPAEEFGEEALEPLMEAFRDYVRER